MSIDKNIQDENFINSVIEGIQEKKGVDISILNMSPTESSIADYFVLCSGTSNTHVDSISDSIEEIVRVKTGEKPLHVEGRENAQWILIDYLDVVVHIFQKPTREFYNLEALWADANLTKVPDIN